MADRLVIIWTTSRVASTSEKRLIEEVAEDEGAIVRSMAMSSLGREIVPALLQGPVVVVVGSRADAATALGIGADEIVRVTKSVTVRKSTLEAAVARARERAHGRTMLKPSLVASEQCPGLALLMRTLERGLGGSPDAAALRCNELTDELARVVAIADRLMQRVQSGAPREALKGWFSEVKDYARATLKAQSLASALQEEVQRTSAVVKLLGTLSSSAARLETDVASLLDHLADFLRGDLAPAISVEVETDGDCVVQTPRQMLMCMACAAVEIALDDIFAKGQSGRIYLRARKADSVVILEVADDGMLGATDLRATLADPLLGSSRASRLRQVRDRARAIGGELIADGDEAGNSVSIYLPAAPEWTTDPGLQKPRSRSSHYNQ
jgi:signal transduction histidine kinase